MNCGRLEFEFLDPAGQAVTPHTAFVDWHRPRFRLIPLNGATAAAGLPAFGQRPGAVAYQPNQGHQATIAYA
jgi:hypothetical protein